MRVIDVKKSNQGKFLCRAENDFGKVSRVFYVSVEVPISWSDFGPWNDCSVSCGIGGIQYRTRICLLSNGIPASAEDYKCVGKNVEMRKCNQLACPVNGGWGKFSGWSKCPKCIQENSSEVPVMSKRERKCESPVPQNGGIGCSGDDTEEIECKVEFCPVKGGWSDWTTWSSCSKTCGDGHRIRKRFCNSPVPKHNGTACDGENVEYEKCRMQPCFNHHLKKTFNAEDEDDLEEMMSNESREKYKEVAEFEIKDENGKARNFQFSNHRELEFSPPLHNSNGFKMPKIKVTLDTYKPISEETYKQHVNRMKLNDPESTSFENLEFESTESIEFDQKPKKTCMNGFSYNSIDKQCKDINECQPSPCAADEICVNTLGSFRCDKKSRRSRN
jgi:Thrombospondin type 1 domain